MVSASIRGGGGQVFANDNMIFGSVCSGIEAASVAWLPLGWRCAWVAEIDPFCRAVLKHHYPEVPNYGDFTQIGITVKPEPVDIIIAGTPCQDFSIAGLRAGLAGSHGQLTLEFIRLINRIRPQWVVWENVPGILSIDCGRAFGTFLAALGKCGYGFAYRILNAQYFGVPQRRRRVFVVGYFGDWRPAAAVLFERASLSSSSTSCKTTQAVTPFFPACDFRSKDDLNCNGKSIIIRYLKVARCLTTGEGHGHDYETCTFVPVINRATYDVRRLTPRECERLQGFPDDYTLVPYRRKLAPNGPRYRALGNTFAVPVVRWLGQRIQIIEDSLNLRRSMDGLEAIRRSSST
jgi:DNA (cytosine-5)-methyltransferase 1